MRLLIHYLLHVHLDDRGQVSSRLVVAEEGSLERPLVQEIHRVGFEGIVLVWHTNQYSHTPSLDKYISAKLHGRSDRRTCKRSKFVVSYIVDAFECGDHGIDIPRALHAPVDTSTGHFSNHLEIKTEVRPKMTVSV